MARVEKRHFLAKGQQGVALLTVLVSMLIMSLLTIEFQYSVAIERKLAYSDLNQLQAHYLAKSGARFGLLRIALFLKANKQFEKNKDIQPKLGSIWSLPLPPFPPATSTLKKLVKEDQDAAEKAIEETKISVGQFSQTISNESSKINLNALALRRDEIEKGDFTINLATPENPKGVYDYVARLLYNTVNDIFIKSDNPYDEFGKFKAEEVVFDIMDWVNPDQVAFGNRNKDQDYDTQKPPYKAKRGRFFTLDELKLVRSVGENLFQKLKPLVTVYSYDGKINLNEANKNVLKAIYPDFTEDDLNKISEEKNKIGSWDSEQRFVDFVTNTLGRSGFKERYREPKEYPFTVKSYSFLIEGIGTIPKNKTVIAKKVKVAVALTSGKGPPAIKNVATKAECDQDQNFFWTTLGQCREKPTSRESCSAIPGEWKEVNGVLGCELTVEGARPFITPPKGGQAKEPDSLKILYWMET